MRWKIVEESVLPKDPRQGPEDAIYKTDWCIGVLDAHSNGATKQIDDATAGQYAFGAGLASLRTLEESGDVTWKDLVPRLAGEVRKWIFPEFPKRKHRPGFVFAGFFEQFGEHGMIVRVGDCQFLIDGKGKNPCLAIERYNAEVRYWLLQEELKSGKTVDELRRDDPARPCIDTLIRKQSVYRNTGDRLFGFGVINGEEVPMRCIEFIPLTGDEHEIILASDGYPQQALARSLAETEANLAKILAEDPLCINLWPSVRGLKPGADRTDDCTYVRLVRS
jgi:hypothetical protein